VGKAAERNGEFGKEKSAQKFPNYRPGKLETYVAAHPDAYQSDMAKAFETHCGGIRLPEKDNQLPGAGLAKSSGVSGRNQRYTAGKSPMSMKAV